ncbi:hypothetical protein CYMTET_38818 [Cymbomonas tetramitiformis]|uniref:Survival protein SurE-like phosphatase/nucleotidase domain-containing protein n=1 Tax=Cymbomonas tetramitiformis TaxID=36881 RepID=A0AAE0F4J5_9CHLO|nr:hypothetical protein CYMTET_38818 [Cymbomonas tetramitiformis]
MSSVRDALGCHAVGIQHGDKRGLSLGQELSLCASDSPDCWILRGASAEDAVTCGLDPSSGLLRSLRLSPVLCVVGINNDPSLSEDADMSATISAAKRASVTGIPSIAVCIASTSVGLPLEPAQMALQAVLGAVGRTIQEGAELTTAANCPRAHFPFPLNGRWSALGTNQLPVDAEIQASLSAASADFAASDCWSLGEMALTNGDASAPKSSPEDKRSILRRAFCDGDTFVCLHVPPRWSLSHTPKPFTSTLPGVIWHQQQSSNQYQPTSEGATFVPQLNTDKVINSTRPCSTSESTSLPISFTIGTGTTLCDSSTRGDVDAVLSGKASLTTLQTWPHSHAFSLLDDLKVEALRESPRGLPLWLDE